MNLSDNPLIAAMQVAKMAHKGQTRTGGGDYYWDHVAVVAKRTQARWGIDLAVVAHLHDVLEDSDLTAGQLHDHFHPHVVDAVVAITKLDGEPYDTYLRRVGENDWARKVKIEDIEHNLETAEGKHRIAKYRVALLYLRSIK